MPDKSSGFGLLDSMPQKPDIRPSPTIKSDKADTRAFQALTRATALENGHRCMVLSQQALDDAEDLRFLSSAQVTGNRLERANYWSQRATAFYALAAALPAE